MDNGIAVVTGITGQDGSYLAEFLLDKGYEVLGVARRSSVDTHERIRHLKGVNGFKIIEGDITDPACINFILHSYQPDEFYNLAAQSHVQTSFEQPSLTWRVNAEGVMNILDGIRYYSPHTRLYQASTSEMFGKNYSLMTQLDEVEIEQHFNLDTIKPKDVETAIPNGIFSPARPIPYQSERTPFSPQSPYAVAKVAAHHSVQLYRRAYGLHASCGILFNHESERRGEQFVTRKITKWIGECFRWHKDHPTIFENGQISLWENMDNDYLYQGGAYTPRFPKLRLGNLDACRDWGHAEDYVKAMWMMLQQDIPDDYVVSTGQTYSVSDFLCLAFKELGVDNFKSYIVQDPAFMRPAEVDYLLGDCSKIREKLGWKPSISFKQLVHRMVQNDLA